MKSRTGIVAWIVAIVVIAIIIAVAWFLHYGRNTPQAAPQAAATTPSPASTSATARHPIARAESTPAAAASSKPLPSLAHSDSVARNALSRLGGHSAATRLLVQRHVIERIVATVNALPRQEIGRNVLPLRSPSGRFAVTTKNGKQVLSQSDFARYQPYMQWVRSADVDALVKWYVHAYPLFQQAYRELGYPHGYFNDRLVAVIDHLLKAPVPEGPIAVKKTSKGYAFADSDLEDLSSGQKLMVRVGPSNEKLLKKKLRALRAAVTGEQGPASAASAKPASAVSR